MFYTHYWQCDKQTPKDMKVRTVTNLCELGGDKLEHGNRSWYWWFQDWEKYSLTFPFFLRWKILEEVRDLIRNYVWLIGNFIIHRKCDGVNDNQTQCSCGSINIKKLREIIITIEVEVWGFEIFTSCERGIRR